MELGMCQRYYEQSERTPGATFSYGERSVDTQIAVGGSNWLWGTINFKVPKRSSPALTFYGSAGVANSVFQNTGSDVTGLSMSCGPNGGVSAFKAGGFSGAYVLCTWKAESEL
jgi:hypothetical protein